MLASLKKHTGLWLVLAAALCILPAVLVSVEARGWCESEICIWLPSLGSGGGNCQGEDVCAEWCEFDGTGMVRSGTTCCIPPGSVYTDDLGACFR